MIRKLLDRLTAAAVAFACASAFCQAAPVIAEEGAAAEETTVSDTAEETVQEETAPTEAPHTKLSSVTIVHTAEISEEDYRPTEWWKADIDEYEDMSLVKYETVGGGASGEDTHGLAHPVAQQAAVGDNEGGEVAAVGTKLRNQGGTVGFHFRGKFVMNGRSLPSEGLGGVVKGGLQRLLLEVLAEGVVQLPRGHEVA